MRHLLFTDKKVLESYIQLPNLAIDTATQVEKKTAFITGATGFIGGFLLKELIQNSTFESYVCLVRAKDEDLAYQRVKENLLQKGCETYLIEASDIKVVTGDALCPSFGLNDPVYTGLLDSIDHVFHFAATMHWITPFNQDSILNIEALKTVIDFCSQAKTKKLHYASSMGLWTLQNHKEGSLLEDELHDQGDELPGGYFQTKWVNERILNLAKAQGLPVNIYRIGDVKGSSENGLGDTQNFGNLVMRYFLKNGISIDCDTPEFNFIPVDYLAKAIAHIAINESGKTYQFSNPELISFKDIYHSAIDTGHDCKLVTKEAWVTWLKNDKSEFGKLLKPIFRAFSPNTGKDATTFYNIGVNMFQKVHDTTHTIHALRDTNIVCPRMLSDKILNKYMIHLGQTNQTTCVPL